VGISPQQSI